MTRELVRRQIGEECVFKGGCGDFVYVGLLEAIAPTLVLTADTVP